MIVMSHAHQSQPRPHHGDRSQVPHCAGVGWLPPSNMLGPCESPVRVRRASESAAIAVGCRYHEGDGNMMHSLTGARHTSRLNGNDHHLGVGRGAEVMHSYMHQHQQPWARKRMSVHEVQDRRALTTSWGMLWLEYSARLLLPANEALGN